MDISQTIIKPRILKDHALWVVATGDGICWVRFLPCKGPARTLIDKLARILGARKSPAGASWAAGAKLGDMKCVRYLKKASGEIVAYLKGKLRDFSVPLDLKVFGRRSAFDRKVWAALCKVPYGSVTTYGNLASRIGRRGAARAVGAAVGRNPLPILIPCHRVVGRGGRLTGFSSGLPIKEILLGIEGFRLSGAARMEDRRVLPAAPAGRPGRAARSAAGPTGRSRKPTRRGRLS